LTKSEVIDAVAEKMSISKVEAEKFINANDEVIIEGLKNDGKVRVGNLGFLNVIYRAERSGLVPKDKTKTYVSPESAATTFAASAALKTIINVPEIIAAVKARKGI